MKKKARTFKDLKWAKRFFKAEKEQRSLYDVNKKDKVY